VIRRTTASASASYTVAAAIARAARREPEVPEGEDRWAKRQPATEGGGDWGRRERSRTSCLRKNGEAAHMRHRCCGWCRHAPVGRLMG